jgi:PhoH-like ATPase
MVKTFVIDTNVILHDFKCIFNFQEHNIIIPIVVLEEIDAFKNGDNTINFHAREFTRILDSLDGDFFIEGVSLGEGLGRLYISTYKESELIKNNFIEDIPDHRILSICDNLKHKIDQVILVTKDVNLRLKAKSIQITTEDYKTDKIENINKLSSDPILIENISSDLISKLYSDIILKSKIMTDDVFTQNQHLILKNGTSSALAVYKNDSIKLIKKENAYGIQPKNAEQTFSLNSLLDPEIKLVALTGKAGTGKTLLALAAALEQRKSYQQIFLARPIVSLSNKDMGYLPGDAKEKMEPYMQPLYDNLNVIKHQYKPTSRDFIRITEMLNTEKLLIEALAYIRGRSLSNIIFIVDEAQNLTPHEVKTIITRAGEGTKIIFTGDIEQIDSPYLDSRSNGLSYLVSKMKGQPIFSHVNLLKGERSYLAELASYIL